MNCAHHFKFLTHLESRFLIWLWHQVVHVDLHLHSHESNKWCFPPQEWLFPHQCQACRPKTILMTKSDCPHSCSISSDNIHWGKQDWSTIKQHERVTCYSFHWPLRTVRSIVIPCSRCLFGLLEVFASNQVILQVMSWGFKNTPPGCLVSASFQCNDVWHRMRDDILKAVGGEASSPMDTSSSILRIMQPFSIPLRFWFPNDCATKMQTLFLPMIGSEAKNNLSNY